MDQLDIMRQQLAELKLQLDNQQIINQDLLRKVMRGKASWIDRFVKFELISLPFIYLLFVGICWAYGISQWYAFAFLICGAIDALLDLRTARIPPSIFSGSIVDMRRFLVKQKAQRFIQTCVMGILCIIWVCLFFAAMATSKSTFLNSDGIWTVASIGGLIGGVLGAIVGVLIIIILYRKMQRTNDQILSDLNQLEAD